MDKQKSPGIVNAGDMAEVASLADAMRLLNRKRESAPKPKEPPKVSRDPVVRFKSYWKMRKIGHLWE